MIYTLTSNSKLALLPKHCPETGQRVWMKFYKVETDLHYYGGEWPDVEKRFVYDEETEVSDRILSVIYLILPCIVFTTWADGYSAFSLIWANIVVGLSTVAIRVGYNDSIYGPKGLPKSFIPPPPPPSKRNNNSK